MKREARAPLIVAIVLLLLGCSKSPPAIKPVVGITARLQKSAEFDYLDSETLIKVPPAEVAGFVKLVTPTFTPFDVYSDEMHYKVAEVYLEHEGGETTTVTVRWTGHNPPAVSVDDQNYFNGGDAVFPDGAINIVRLLNQYLFEQKQQREAGTQQSERVGK